MYVLSYYLHMLTRSRSLVLPGTGLSFMDQPDHVDRILMLGAELIQAASQFCYPGSDSPVTVRVGVSTGYVASGLMGSIR